MLPKHVLNHHTGTVIFSIWGGGSCTEDYQSASFSGNTTVVLWWTTLDGGLVWSPSSFLWYCCKLVPGTPPQCFMTHGEPVLFFRQYLLLSFVNSATFCVLNEWTWRHTIQKFAKKELNKKHLSTHARLMECFSVYIIHILCTFWPSVAWKA